MNRHIIGDSATILARTPDYYSIAIIPAGDSAHLLSICNSLCIRIFAEVKLMFYLSAKESTKPQLTKAMTNIKGEFEQWVIGGVVLNMYFTDTLRNY